MYIDPIPDQIAPDLIDGEPNAGGLAQLWLIPSLFLSLLPVARLAEFGLPDLAIDLRQIQLVEGANFTDVPILIDYASYSENLENSLNGNYYAYQIQLVIPKDRPAVAAWLHRGRELKWIAVIQDRNGVARIIGNQAQPLTRSFSNGSGAKTGRNGRTVTFAGSMPSPAPYLEAPDYEVLSMYVSYLDNQSVL